MQRFVKITLQGCASFYVVQKRYFSDQTDEYPKFVNRSTSWLVPQPMIFWLFLEGKFDAYAL